ncbi:MAG: hypothetical protein ACKOBN_08510 [Flavobacteriales bacterium]
MFYKIVVFIGALILFSCSQEKQDSFDYIQYEPFDLSTYDLPASIMLPDASAGIGTSLKPKVIYEIGDFKWRIDVGRNFAMFIEDYGDNALRFAEFKRKLFKPNKYFDIQVVDQSKNIIIYKRVVKGEYVEQPNEKYHIYSVCKIADNYYEIMNREQGDSKRVVDFMFHSIQSIQSK